jgi:hypothetical protein
MGHFLPTLFAEPGDGALAGKHLILLSQPLPGAGIGTINSWKTTEANNFTGSWVAFTRVRHRETREGWPQLPVETEANEESWSTNEMVPPWLVRGARCAGTRDFCPALAALVSPERILTVHYFSSFVPIAQ